MKSLRTSDRQTLFSTWAAGVSHSVAPTTYWIFNPGLLNANRAISGCSMFGQSHTFPRRLGFNGIFAHVSDGLSRTRNLTSSSVGIRLKTCVIPSGCARSWSAWPKAAISRRQVASSRAFRGLSRSRYCGYSHHHWLCEQTASGLEFTFKHAQLHGYNRFHLCVGPQIAAASPHHNWMEILDPVQQLFAVVNRWFREIDPKYYALGLFWTGSFTSQEKILIDKGHVEADLMAFKERCRHIDDLWRWKRNWYGKRIR